MSTPSKPDQTSQSTSKFTEDTHPADKLLTVSAYKLKRVDELERLAVEIEAGAMLATEKLKGA